MMNPWIIAYLVVSVVELYFFMTQRTALEVCRAQGLPDDRRGLLLPRWYFQYGRLMRVAKWATLVGIFVTVAWWVALLCWLVTFILISLTPIPRGYFLRQLAKRFPAGRD